MTFHMWCWTSKWKLKRQQLLQQMYSDFRRQMGKTGDWWKLIQYRPHLNSMNNPPLIKRPPPIQRGKNKIRGDQQTCCVPLTSEEAHILLLWVCNFRFSTKYIASLFSLQKKKKNTICHLLLPGLYSLTSKVLICTFSIGTLSFVSHSEILEVL